MQSTPRERLEQFAHVLQDHLFGCLEEQIGPLSEKARLLVAVLSAVPLGRYIAPSRGWVGRPPKDRLALAAAFLAKAVYGIETTRRMLDQLRQDRQLRCICGWNSASAVLVSDGTSSAAIAAGSLDQKSSASPCASSAASSWLVSAPSRRCARRRWRRTARRPRAGRSARTRDRRSRASRAGFD